MKDIKSIREALLKEGKAEFVTLSVISARAGNKEGTNIILLLEKPVVRFNDRDERGVFVESEVDEISIMSSEFFDIAKRNGYLAPRCYDFLHADSDLLVALIGATLTCVHQKIEKGQSNVNPFAETVLKPESVAKNTQHYYWLNGIELSNEGKDWLRYCSRNK